MVRKKKTMFGAPKTKKFNGKTFLRGPFYDRILDADIVADKLRKRQNYNARVVRGYNIRYAESGWYIYLRKKGR